MTMAPSPIMFYRVAGVVRLDQAEWPAVATFSNTLVRQADPRLLCLRYPFLTIRVANGHAVYRVDTCEHDTWTGTLVEGVVRTEATR